MSKLRSLGAVQLPTPGRQERRVFQRRRRPPRWRQLLTALAMGGLGAGLLGLLLHLPRRFDTVLLVSKALANLISGVQQLAMGLVQLTALAVLVLAALAGVVLVLACVVRLVRVLLLAPRR